MLPSLAVGLRSAWIAGRGHRQQWIGDSGSLLHLCLGPDNLLRKSFSFLCISYRLFLNFQSGQSGFAVLRNPNREIL
jgi:hypothetical protein